LISGRRGLIPSMDWGWWERIMENQNNFQGSGRNRSAPS
jgi:hypothetical protein